MADEQVDERVTVGEEIRCLLDAGWTWDGDKLSIPLITAFGLCIKGLILAGSPPGLSSSNPNSGKPFVRHSSGVRGNGRRVTEGGYDAVRSSEPCPSAPDHGLSSTRSTPFRIPSRVSFEL